MGACEAYRDRISAYLDGELTGEERRELLAHLEICGDCRMYLDSELAIREALAGLETPAPAGLEARGMENLRAGRERRGGGGQAGGAGGGARRRSRPPGRGAGGGGCLPGLHTHGSER